MDRDDAVAAAMLEKVREFERVAELLDMPAEEKLGILNVSEETYVALCAGRISCLRSMRPEVERRLSYALPLMRRLAGTDVGVRVPRSDLLRRH